MEYETPIEIYDLAKNFNDMYEQIYLELRDDVTYIIKKRIRNTEFIESTLDNILDIPTDKAYDLLLELCNYYMTIDKKTALFYLDSYGEIYGEEGVKVRKKDYK